VSMRNGEKPTRKLIEGIADTVAGSVASMDRARVRIIVDGMPYNVDNRDSTVIGHSSDYIEAEMAATRAYEDQVRRILAYFSGDVLVSVRVKIDTVSSQTQETRIDKIDQKEATIETESTTAIGPASVGGEPGTASNTGLALGSGEASSPGSSLEKERTRTDFLNLPSQTQETRVKRGGDVTPVSATVRVPHQQLIEMMKAKVGGTSTADEETLNRYVSEELASIHKAVKNTLKLQDDEVFVDTYVSTMPAMIAAAAGDVPAAGISGSLTSHAKEIAIGALAVISLVMVSMMVRKSGPATTLPAPIDQNDAHRILAAEHFVGEAISSSTTLDGMELDDDALRAQQMVEQVSTMVKENPESAANLVKRWLNRS
jgi:flagellar M-ring protein FliF